MGATPVPTIDAPPGELLHDAAARQRLLGVN
jgi:hypothetical protein